MTGALQPWSEPVLPEWIDYNDHLSEAYYVLVFGHATDSVMGQIGMTPEHLRTTRTSLFTVEAHVRYLDQVTLGEEVQIRSRIIGADAKRLWLWHEMWSGGRLRATEEILGLHVDASSGPRTAPFPPHVAARIESFRNEPPPDAARSIALG